MARGHANHGERIAVQGDRTTNDLRIRGETALPEVMAEDDDRVAADGTVVLGTQEAAQVRLRVPTTEK